MLRPLAKSSEPVIFLLLDFDNCGDLFSPQIKNMPTYKQVEEKARLILEQLLNKITKDHKEVVLCVFSNRQSKLSNFENMINNHNGSCFHTFEKLCQERGWTFCTYLLSDLDNGINIGLKGESMFGINGFTTSPLFLNVPDDITKPRILNMHIQVALREFPHRPIKFFVIDDDYKDIIFKSLKKELEDNHSHDKYRDFFEFNLLKFDYFPDGKMEQVPHFTCAKGPENLRRWHSEIIPLAKGIIESLKMTQNKVKSGLFSGEFNRPIRDLLTAYQSCHETRGQDRANVEHFLECVNKFESRGPLAKKLRHHIECLIKHKKMLTQRLLALG